MSTARPRAVTPLVAAAVALLHACAAPANERPDPPSEPPPPVATAAPHPGPISDFGGRADGVRIRARCPAAAEQGERIPAAIEIDYDEAQLADGVTHIDLSDFARRVTLRLVPEGGGEALVVPAETVLTPPQPPGPAHLLDGTPVPRQTVQFPLVRIAPVPGNHDARVEYEPEWGGVVTTASFPFTVTEETPDERVFLLPRKLVLSAGPRICFPKEAEEFEEIHRTIPNGWYVGMRITRDGEETIGWLGPGDEVAGAFDPDEPLDTEVAIEIFRTMEPPGHFWGRLEERTTVARRTYRVRATAAELRSLR